MALLREVCNDLIMQACKFVPGESKGSSPCVLLAILAIVGCYQLPPRRTCQHLAPEHARHQPAPAGPELLQMEPGDAVDKLRSTLRVLGTFKSYYFEYRGRAGLVCPENPWRASSSALFARLDAFMGRCHDVLELCVTSVQFSRLERVEVGGSMGRLLSAAVRAVHADYTAAAAHFQDVEYDVMDLAAPNWGPDFQRWRWVVQDLERRLASIIVQVGVLGDGEGGQGSSIPLLPLHATGIDSHPPCPPLTPGV